MIQYDNRGNKVIPNGSEDPRYTIGIYLIRNQRPKYWNFYCPFCGEKVSELNGTVVYMADVVSENINGAARVRCNSRKCGGRSWFSFQF